MSGDGPLGFEPEHDAEEHDRRAPSRTPGAAGDAPAGREAGGRRPVVPGPGRPAPGTSRFTWVVGIAVLLVGVTIMLNAVGEGQEARPGGPPPGERLAAFAAPDADSGLQGDANVATEETVGEEAGRRPACEVRGPDVVNVCALYERGPVVLALFPADAGRCRAVLRQFERVRGEFAGRVTFAAVGSGKDDEDESDRGALRGYAFPVAYDHDGLVGRLYGLVGCPQITFARRGGQVVKTTHRDLTDAELRAEIRALLR